MLRFTPIENAKQAESYYSRSDGGYYLQAGDLHREWGGRGAALLGLSGPPDYEQFKRLIHGLDPHTGEQLTAKLIEDRIPGWDVTASVPKGVTTALERGDARIRQALWETGRETMADLEDMATTRVRKGGRQEDRRTGNLLWYAKEDPETRPTKEDGMSDWDRHIHFVVYNLTRDEVEDEWKAVKFRPIMDLRKWFSTRFDLRLASKLVDLGYAIETKYKADGQGGKRYYSWDIQGIPPSVITKNSRRSAEVEQAEQEAIKAIKERDPDPPDALSAVARDKLGATSRLPKRGDLTLANYRDYWNGRITPQEGRQIAETIQRAMKGLNPRPANTADKGVAYAIAHQFERHSVVPQKELEITAMECCLDGALPEEIEPECHQQGVLTKDGQATTKDILEQEGRILAFAREGRGTMRPLREASVRQGELASLSAEQQALVNHVMQSTDQVVLVIGDAGTGKTTAIKPMFQAIHRPIEMLAPSAEVFDHNKPLVDDYMAALEAKQSVLVVAPTHREADEVTAQLRQRLKQEGKLAPEDHLLGTLKPLHWTDAQKADTHQYDGTEIVQFHRNSGPFRAGERVAASDLLPQLARLRPGHFSVYAPGSRGFAEKDLIRITANGWNKSRKHRLDNGYTARIAAIGKEGDLTLDNGWVINTPHMTHGYVSTSYARQGKTVDVALAAMGHESLPAVNAAQFYVTASRARHEFRLYTDVSPATLREAIPKQDTRKSATELLGRPAAKDRAKRKERVRGFVKRVHDYYRRLRQRVEEATRDIARERGMSHAGFAR